MRPPYEVGLFRLEPRVSVGVRRKELRRNSIGNDPGFLHLGCKAVDMLKGELSCHNVPAVSRRRLARIASEDDDVKQRVAHKTVSAVDSADSLARDIEILNVGRHAVGTDVKTAVLIVERRALLFSSEIQYIFGLLS